MMRQTSVGDMLSFGVSCSWRTGHYRVPGVQKVFRLTPSVHGVQGMTKEKL